MNGKNFKYILAGIILIMLFSNSSALTLDISEGRPFKGDVISISGECDKNEELNFAFFEENRAIFEKIIPCGKDGTYSFDYEISFLDPEGKWLISVEQNEEKLNRNIMVSPVKESNFFVITFLSPSSTIQYRHDNININVRITDAGNFVNDANVIFWDIEGKKHYLLYQEEGIYSFEYEMPIDAKTEIWELKIMAESLDMEKRGGETKLNISIEKAQFLIDVISPKLKSIETGNDLIVKAEITYLNGKEFNGTAKLKINSQEFELEKLDDKLYYASIFISDDYQNTDKIVISIEDGFGNSATKEIDLLIVSGVFSFIATIAAYLISALVIVVIIVFVIYPRLSRNLEIKKLRLERKKLNDRIKRLQRDYYDKNIVDKKNYTQKLAELETKLNEVKKQLNKR